MRGEGNGGNRPNLGKPLPILMILLLGMVMIFLVTGSGSAGDVFSQYNTLTNGGKAGITPQLQFLRVYTLTTGDTSLALSAGLSQDEIDNLIENGHTGDEDVSDDGPTTPDGWNSSNHNHYAIRQGNYSNVQLGKPSGTVSNNGCGLCSLIAATAELADVTYTPENFKSSFPNTINVGWDNGNSNGFYMAGVTQFAADATASSHIPGTYTVTETFSGTPNSDSTTQEILGMIMEHCGDENKIAIISTCGDNSGNYKNSNGLFTGGGHIICVTDLVVDEDGYTYMHLSDSSGVAAWNLGKDWSSMSNLNIPIKDNNGNYIYKAMGKDANDNPMLKYYWIKWIAILERTS